MFKAIITATVLVATATSANAMASTGWHDQAITACELEAAKTNNDVVHKSRDARNKVKQAGAHWWQQVFVVKVGGVPMIAHCVHNHKVNTTEVFYVYDEGQPGNFRTINH